MDIEKYRQYAKSRARVSEMRKEIRDHLDKFKTAQRAGYEAAKIQYKPLLEAQEAQTKAQEVQIEAMRQLQKTPGLSKDTQDFIINNGFIMPSSLLKGGIEAFKAGEEEAWKEMMLDLSVHLRELIEGNLEPKTKKAADEYRKSLTEVASTVLKQQPKNNPFLTPSALSPTTSMDTLTEESPQQKSWFSWASPTTPTEAATKTQPENDAWYDNFNKAFSDNELLILDELNLTHPNQLFKEGLDLKKKSIEEYQLWLIETQELRDQLARNNSKKGAKNKK